MRRIIPFIFILSLTGCAQADIDKNLASLKTAFTPKNTEAKQDEPPVPAPKKAVAKATVAPAQPAEEHHSSPVLDALKNAFGVSDDTKTAEAEEPKDAPATHHAKEASTDSVRKSLVFVSRAVPDIHTLAVYFKYEGAKPLRNLDLVASTGGEQSHDRTKQTIAPGTTLVAHFAFDNADLSRTDVNAIPVKVAYAESP